jgi:hypothetical protein
MGGRIGLHGACDGTVLAIALHRFHRPRSVYPLSSPPDDPDPGHRAAAVLARPGWHRLHHRAGVLLPDRRPTLDALDAIDVEQLKLMARRVIAPDVPVR